MTSMTSFPLVELFIPEPLGYVCIGSRAYNAHKESSDFDFMVRLENKHLVIEHLRRLNVAFEQTMSGSVKFVAQAFPGKTPEFAELVFNFCFVSESDWAAWLKATNVMQHVSQIVDFKTVAKKTRLALFSDLVTEFGGQCPVFPGNCS